MEKIYSIVVALALTVSTSFAAGNVAVISDVNGKVLVNKGKGFVAVVGSLELDIGDRVMVGQDSFATLSYEQCSVSLTTPGLVDVAAKPNCDVVTPTAAALGGLSIPLIVGGAVVVTGIAYVATDGFGTNDDDCAAGVTIC